MMNKLMLMSVLGVLIPCAVHAGESGYVYGQPSNEFTPELITPVGNQSLEAHVVVMRDLPDDVPSATKSVEEPIKQFMPVPQDLPVNPSSAVQATDILDPEVTRAPLPSPSLAASFQALDDSLRTIPPDTNGTVGLNHVMTTLNDRVRIQTKTGTILKTVTLSTFWGASGPFDPRVVYDPYNNRWIFCVTLGARSATSSVGLAVSQTNDPMGAWNIFFVTADSSGATWADFPCLGFNNKWIAIQANMFSVSDSSFVSSRVFVFNKAQAYAGTNNVRIILLDGLGGVQAPAITYNNTLPDLYFIQNWNGNTGGNGLLRLYKMSGNFGSETITPVTFVQINGKTWSSSAPLTNFAPQLGTSVRITNNDARTPIAVVRYNSIWTAHTVFLPAGNSTHSAAQWWQISLTGVIQQFGRVEDTTATLNSGTFYAFPTISVNVRNDALLGYSQFSPTTYASAGYSFRLGNDPLHVMRAPTILKSGLATYTKDFGGSRVRWGDYSGTTADPNGYDLWTIQEYADTHASDGQSRWATWWGRIAPLTACTCS